MKEVAIQASAKNATCRIVNAMSVDVEDYFQVSAFEGSVRRDDWDRLESRVCRNTYRILDIFARAGVRATFFVLGWVAERHPALVRQIVLAGHELASHGFEHRLVYSMTPREFRDDIRRARFALEDAGGCPVMGYRAPSFSITHRSLWALDVLVEEGFVYDASIYPVRHDRYGIVGWPRHFTTVRCDAGAIIEVPGSTVRWAGQNFAMGGGGYFRLLPYEWTRFGIQTLNTRERRPAVFYLHPWEIDPDQPRLAVGVASRFRHYRNLDKTEARLERLLSEFAFGAIVDQLEGEAAPMAAVPLRLADLVGA